jgi:hypothetical protein
MNLFGIELRDLALPAFLVGWLVISRFVLPKLGVPT